LRVTNGPIKAATVGRRVGGPLKDFAPVPSSQLIFLVAPGHYRSMKLLERITVERASVAASVHPGFADSRHGHLGMLAEGVAHEEILRDFPYLEPDDIKAALTYAARQADHAVLQPS
jgi:hypothetical protein